MLYPLFLICCFTCFLPQALHLEVARGTALTNKLLAAQKVHAVGLASCRRVSKEKAAVVAELADARAEIARLRVSREELLRPFTPRPDWGALYVEYRDVDAAATLASYAAPATVPPLVLASEQDDNGGGHSGGRGADSGNTTVAGSDLGHRHHQSIVRTNSSTVAASNVVGGGVKEIRSSQFHVTSLLNSLRAASAHEASLSAQLVLSVDVQRATKATVAALKSEVQALKAGGLTLMMNPTAGGGGGGNTSRQQQRSAGNNNMGSGTGNGTANALAMLNANNSMGDGEASNGSVGGDVAVSAPILGLHTLLPQEKRTELVFRLAGASKTLQGLGQGTRDAPIPEFLRITGKVRHRVIARRDCEQFIYDVWRSKMLHDTRRGYLDLNFADYFGMYLRGKFGLPSIVADYSYNLIDATYRYQAFSDCDVFLKVLSGQYQEELYYNQVRVSPLNVTKRIVLNVIFKPE